MISNDLLRSRVLATCAALSTTALAGLATPAQAQSNESSGASQIEEVVVTGSRLRRPDLDSPSPISIVNEEFFEQKGTVNVEEVLNQLPQIVPGLGSQVNNGGDGTATVDLRGLGPTRTLVLINGRRFVPATNTGRTDLNAIPANLLERVEVVTGGASAVYGSDALAGVVNFILKDDFEGIEMGARFGQSTEGDAKTKDVFATFGGNFADDRGNAVIALSYYQRDPLFQDAREFTAVDRQSNGSATGIAGRLDNSPFNPFGAFNGTAAGSNYAFNANGTVRRFVNALPETNNGVGDRYNFAPVNYLATPQTRRTLDAFLTYNINESAQAYVETYYIQNRQNLNLAPTPATNLVLPVTNPLLTQSARDLLATRVVNPASPLPTGPNAPAIFRRRMVEFGPRLNVAKFDLTQIVAGAKGKLANDWNWDTYYSFGRTDSNVGIEGDISKARLNASLAGCPAGSPAGCRVVDFFGPGKISAADVAFLRIGSAVDTLVFDRQLVAATANGPVGTLPAGEVSVAVGVEYREDKSIFNPSEASLIGDLSGFNPMAPISGGFDVKEGYAEIGVPLLRDKPGAQNLSFSGAVRVSDYSTVGQLTTYKGSLEWSPVDQLKVRGSYAKASRAPSVFELFQAGDTNAPTVTDPCALIRPTGAPQVVTPATQLICQFSGLPAPGTLAVQSNSQATSSRVGNTNLDQEDGKTFTAGLVWQPPFLRGFSATLDYYDIKVTNYITRLAGGEASQVTACFTSGVTTAAQYAADPNCANIGRQSNGDLFITSPLVNTGELKTNGFDLALNYAFGWDNVGKFSVRADAGYMNSYNLDGNEYVSQTSTDFGTLPKLRTNLRLVYDRGPFQASANWQRWGEVDTRPGDAQDGNDVTIPAFNYLDLAGRYRFGSDENYDLAIAITNVTNKSPPLILTGFTNTNTDNSTYDSIGRRYVVSVTAKF